MKILVLYHYPPAPGGLATQADLLYKGLLEIGVDARPAHLQSDLEKEWYYHWFKPDAVVGVGFWGDVPDLVLHPQRFGLRAVPWILADGYVANYRDVLDALPLILVPSDWVRETFVRDGIRGDHDPPGAPLFDEVDAVAGGPLGDHLLGKLGVPEEVPAQLRRLVDN